MLSLEKEFRDKLLPLYRDAPLDAASFHRPYRACGPGECGALCCNGGSGFYLPEEPQTIRRLVQTRQDFFAAQQLPEELFEEEWNDEKNVTEYSTAVRPAEYPPGVLPPHFPSTACIFRAPDGACTLQRLGVAEGKPGWWYKPVACWLFPLEIEYDGKPFIRVAHASTDEYVDADYPGFVGFTRCGAECAGGRPAYLVLEHEIAALSKLIDRDLLGEILAYKETAA